MSKFLTSFPFPLDELLESIPKHSFIHKDPRTGKPLIQFNHENNSLQISWENDRFESGLVVPVEFSPQLLKSKKLPEGVRDIRRPATKVEPVAEVKTPEPEPPKVPAPVYLTSAEFELAKSEGKAIEFQGIEPTWKPVEPGHEFTQGFFYRLKPVDTEDKK